MKRYQKAIGVMLPSKKGDWVTFSDHLFETEDFHKEIERLEDLLRNQKNQIEKTSALLTRIVNCFPPNILEEQINVLIDILESDNFKS